MKATVGRAEMEELQTRLESLQTKIQHVRGRL
jgi:tetrahydromethanopterin S-methyltransferase subunit G